MSLRREALERKIELIRQQLARRRIKLARPLSAEQVERWESQNSLRRLPDEYRRFVTEIGDGGPGPPDFGVWPLRREDVVLWDPAYEWARDTSRLSRPFPLRKAWKWSEREWARFLDEDSAMQKRVDRLDDGNFIIGTDGCTCFWHLITSGPAAGQIWFSDGESVHEPIATDFLSWYEAWLKLRPKRRVNAPDVGSRKRLRRTP